VQHLVRKSVGLFQRLLARLVVGHCAGRDAAAGADLSGHRRIGRRVDEEQAVVAGVGIERARRRVHAGRGGAEGGGRVRGSRHAPALVHALFPVSVASFGRCGGAGVHGVVRLGQAVFGVKVDVLQDV